MQINSWKFCIFAPMKHLVIRNLGPLHEADIELKRINVIIGSQSSGKSCVLKTACYCTWVEKRIELTQSADKSCDGPVHLGLCRRIGNQSSRLQFTSRP